MTCCIDFNRVFEAYTYLFYNINYGDQSYTYLFYDVNRVSTSYYYTVPTDATHRELAYVSHIDNLCKHRQATLQRHTHRDTVTLPVTVYVIYVNINVIAKAKVTIKAILS